MMEKEINEKWEEVLDFAMQHATKKGLHTGIKWLEVWYFTTRFELNWALCKVLNNFSNKQF